MVDGEQTGDGGDWLIRNGPQADAVWDWFAKRPDVLAFSPDPEPQEPAGETKAPEASPAENAPAVA